VRVCCLKWNVNPGHVVVILPNLSRYQLEHPPISHTDFRKPRWIQALWALCASWRTSTVAMPRVVVVPDQIPQIIQLRLDHENGRRVTGPRSGPGYDIRLGKPCTVDPL